MNNKLLVVTALMAGLSLAGCSSTGKKDSMQGQNSADSMSTGTAGSQSSVGRSIDTAERQGPDISQKVIYFEFDSSELKPSDLATVANHAQYLSANPSLRVRLEGHADERGTREYNIGLGERRANAVSQALQLRGVSARQISVVSYGEERPVALGHTEEAWAQNRRVEIVYP